MDLVWGLEHESRDCEWLWIVVGLMLVRMAGTGGLQLYCFLTVLLRRQRKREINKNMIKESEPNVVPKPIATRVVLAD